MFTKLNRPTGDRAARDNSSDNQPGHHNRPTHLTQARRRPEQQLQRAVVEHLRWRAAPGVWFCHLANGGWRSAIEAAILKSIGVTPGAPDLLVVRDGRAHFLELKANGGRLTQAQRDCHDRLRAAGAEVAIARDIDQALELLSQWRVLR